MTSYQMTITCDGCGFILHSSYPKITSIPSDRWAAEEQIKKDGGMRVTRMGGSTIHYCGKYADSAPANRDTK